MGFYRVITFYQREEAEKAWFKTEKNDTQVKEHIQDPSWDMVTLGVYETLLYLLINFLKKKKTTRTQASLVLSLASKEL